MDEYIVMLYFPIKGNLLVQENKKKKKLPIISFQLLKLSIIIEKIINHIYYNSYIIFFLYKKC